MLITVNRERREGVMFTSKRPEVSLKGQYDKVIRLSLIGSLLVLITIFLVIPKVESRVQRITSPVPPISSIDIPPAIDRTLPPEPERPPVPIASPTEEIPDDPTIEPTTFENYKPVKQPPEPPVATIPEFVPDEESKPEPIGGYKALMENIRYPEIARESGVHGIVSLRAYIDKYGNVTDIVIIKGIPSTRLNEAAIDAVKKTKFRPAQQRDHAVGVWMNLNINFSLNR